MFDMTLQEALDIQETQVQWYGPQYPGGADALRAEMRKRTHIPEGADLNEKRDILSINKCVPRGGNIEYVVFGKDLGGD